MVDHQRLSGSGYVFSASLPPVLAVSATATLRRFLELHSSAGAPRLITFGFALLCFVAGERRHSGADFHASSDFLPCTVCATSTTFG